MKLKDLNIGAQFNHRGILHEVTEQQEVFTLTISIPDDGYQRYFLNTVDCDDLLYDVNYN